MSYTSTNWLEHSMNTAVKLAALDNLEGMYTQAVAYIDAITHSDSYYTDAQCDTNFFTAVTDGTGSGLICATLDGYTADQIIAAGSPPGVIAWWSGSEGAIPSGWVLCNGLNSTPDLRNRFVVGAGSHYNKGDMGGAITVTTTASITVAGHALTANETPLHTHGYITDYYRIDGSGQQATSGSAHVVGPAESNTNHTEYAGSGNAHTHTASYTGSVGQTKISPYYALCYIMKS